MRRKWPRWNRPSLSSRHGDEFEQQEQATAEADVEIEVARRACGRGDCG
ncbi:hypothetical protein PR003_g32678 [Phytophthora rubi]|uniref:Uncharacterized protein n=1 Tax=Phytophthora rubi TaxID=129364 RepID=A0A6A4B0C1_9STRA|nr:hypothetical protein PR003_g32678 [Phytophthora rubi]